MASTSNDSTVAIWCIDDYVKRYRQASIDDWWISELFAFDHPQFGPIKFYLRFTPKYDIEPSNACIEMHIMDPPATSSISLNCNAWIETYDKRRYRTKAFNHDFLNGAAHGCSHYETLIRLGKFIVEGPFSIYCNIRPITAFVAPHHEPIFDQGFASFFNNPFFSDAEIHVDNKIFKICRAIVSGSSPIFRAMFDKKIKEQTSGVVRIDRFEVAMVEKMLIYIYENKVDNLNDIAAELLPVADYYQIDSLVKICVDSIVTNLTTKNVLSVLQLAFDRPHLKELRVRALKFTYANYNEIRQLDGFEEFFDSQPEIANQLLEIFPFIR
ncbi:Speckle-type POZ protein A-like protein [Aphelenchoides besseyi]|nr:Speckle-type POZ protein A-like protein [Aphelenchoides besseyi]